MRFQTRQFLTCFCFLLFTGVGGSGLTIFLKAYNSKSPKRFCRANSKRGRDEAHSIRASKLEDYPFFFLNFKGTPSQEEHKTIFRA
jgi:hypothetical protein